MSSLKRDVSLGLVHMVNVILVLMAMKTLSIVLILKDLGQNAFILRTIGVMLSIVLNVHTSSVNSIELIFNLS